MTVPSDHLIPDHLEFHKAIVHGLTEVNNNNLVAFGVTPTRPDTGYGYLEISSKLNTKSFKLEKFIENQIYLLLKGF